MNDVVGGLCRCLLAEGGRDGYVCGFGSKGSNSY